MIIPNFILKILSHWIEPLVEAEVNRRLSIKEPICLPAPKPINYIHDLIETDPEMVCNILRNWLREDEPKRKYRTNRVPSSN